MYNYTYNYKWIGQVVISLACEELDFVGDLRSLAQNE